MLEFVKFGIFLALALAVGGFVITFIVMLGSFLAGGVYELAKFIGKKVRKKGDR